MSHGTSSNTSKRTRQHHKVTTPFDAFITLVAQRIGGGKSKEFERFIKFAVVGVLGFLIDSGTVAILQNTFLPPVDKFNQELALNVAIAQSIAFVLAVGSNFVWNRLWTYPDARSYSIHRQLTQFAIVSVIGWLIRTLWISMSYKFLAGISTTILLIFFPDYQPNLLDKHKLGTMIALFFGVIVVMFWNFLANRYWTYNDVD